MIKEPETGALDCRRRVSGNTLSRGWLAIFAMKSDCADLQASLAVDAAMHYEREEPALGGAAVVLIRGIYHLNQQHTS